MSTNLSTFDWAGMEMKVFTLTEAAQDTITATPSGNQATAYQLTAANSRVTVVGTSADSVLAPYTAKKGRTFSVINSSGTSMQLFGIGTDTVNGAAAATGVAVAGGKTAQMVCYTDGAWRGPVALA